MWTWESSETLSSLSNPLFCRNIARISSTFHGPCWARICVLLPSAPCLASGLARDPGTLKSELPRWLCCCRLSLFGGKGLLWLSEVFSFELAMLCNPSSSPVTLTLTVYRRKTITLLFLAGFLAEPDWGRERETDRGSGQRGEQKGGREGSSSLCNHRLLSRCLSKGVLIITSPVSGQPC